MNLPGALRRYRDGPSSKSFAITGKRPVVSVHYEHPQRESRANGVQHEHHARIMMEQKEHTRERSMHESIGYVQTHTYTQAKHVRAHTHIHTHSDDDAPMLHCYYLAFTPPVRRNTDGSVAGS